MIVLRHLLTTLALILSLATLSKAQGGNTTVTATVRDPNGSLYTNSQVGASFIGSGQPAGVLPLLNGSTFQTSLTGFGTDSFGKFSLNLADTGAIDTSSGTINSQWRFSICFSDRATCFTYTTPINCLTNTPASCSSGVMDISAQLQAVAAILPTISGSGSGTFIVKNGIPCASTVTFTLGNSATPSANTAFSSTLNCNITSTSVVATSGLVQPGSIAQFTFTQNGIGGFNVTWPANFIDQPIIQGGPNATTSASFWFDGTNWHQQTTTSVAPSAAGPVGTLQCTNGSGTLVTCGLVDNGTVLAVNRESSFKGPDPYTDARAYNVRAVNQTIAPAVPGITGNCISTSASLTISSASTFQNGDGIVAFGCGLANNVTTPTGLAVTPVVAASGTGTGLVTSAPSGSTQYCYTLIAEGKGGGFSAAPAQVCTATGAASLGAQSVTITGWTRSGQTATVTTSANHGLAICTSNCVPNMVYMFSSPSNNADNLYFGGWFVTTTVPDTTHFTYVTGNDSASGAPTVSIGGGVTHTWNANHLTWTSQPNAFVYDVYGRTNGSLVWLGRTKVQSTVNGQTPDTTFDDFGSPMMDGALPHYWIPNTPPVSPQADNLVTVINSGAGTTTLTLRDAATTSVTNATILFDNAPNILTAAQTVGGFGLLYFPVNSNPYVINSYLTLPNGVSMNIAGATLWMNATMEIGSANKIYGMLGAQGTSFAQFGYPVGGFITANRASPAIYGRGFGDNYFYGFQVFVQNNQGTGMLLDLADNSSFNYLNFQGNSGLLMDIPLELRYTDFLVSFDHIALLESQPILGSTATPSALLNNVGNSVWSNISMNGRGIFKMSVGNNPGETFTLSGSSRCQGCGMPFFTYSSSGQGSVGGAFKFSDVELDTMQQALFANLPVVSNFIGGLTINGGNAPALGFGEITGSPVGNCVGGCSGQNVNVIVGSNFTNNQVTVNGTKGEVGYAMSPPAAAPGLALSAGGSVPVASNIPYSITAVDINGAETPLSAIATITTTSGNQTVTITPPALPTGSVGYKPYRGGQLVNFTNCLFGASVASGTPTIDNSSFTCGPGTPASGGSSSGLGALGLFGYSLALSGGGFKDTLTFTGTSSVGQILPDVNGTVGILTGAFTATHCLQASGSGVTLSIVDSGGTCGGGGGGATFQVDGTNTSNQTTINFQDSSAFNGLTATFSNPSAGNVKLGFSGTLGNAGLTNSSLTVNTSSPLSGGGAVSLGSALTLTCPTCSTAVINTGTSNHIARYTASGAPATISSDAAFDDGATAPNTLTYTGSGGVVAPSFTSNSPGGFALSGAEGSSPSGVGASDIIWASSIVHRFEMNNNNTGTVVVAANPMTAAGDLTYGGSVVSTVATETRLAAGTATQVLHSGTTPSWGPVVLTTDVSSTLPVANGGCAASTAANCLINIFPVATRAGDVIYWDGAVWNHLAGNNSGTQFLSENASGVPSWSSSAGGVALSAITAASGSNTIANGNNPQVWNWAQTTASQSAFTFGETTAAVGVGDIELNIKTLNTSTAIPWQVTAQGTTVGWNISTTGLLEPLSTGAIATGGTAHGFTLSEGSTTAIASLVCGTNTVPLGGGASADPTCGTVPNAALTNSSVTFNTVTVALGASGNISLDLITNPAASKTFTFPAAGVLSLTGTAPGSSAGAGTGAGTFFNVGAVTGGATTGSATTAGNGSSISEATGDGGSGAGGTNANGGNGGSYTLTIGAGGAKSGSGVAGINGAINFQQDITTAVANSPAVNIIGEYQNSGTPTFAADTWTLQGIIGAGTNGTTSLTFSHIGSSGTATVVVPNLTDSALTNGNCVQAGAGGILTTVAGACAAGGSGTVSGGVSGDLGSFTSATAITDSGIVAANVVTQTSNAASGQVCTYTGTNKVCVPATALPNGVTATTQSQLDGSTKVSTTLYVDTAVSNAIAGVNPAESVVAASTSSQTGTYNNGVSGVGATFTITATGTYTLDGVSISTIGQRVLFKDQSSAFQNGVYTATVVGTTGISAVFTRALDYNQPSDINSTGAIPVVSGTVNANTSWLLTSTVTTVGTDALTYAQFTLAPSTIVTASASAAAANQVWVSGGANKTAVALTFPMTKYAPAADCVNAVAGSAWSTGATPAALCRAGTNNKSALLSPWGASDVGYIQFHIDKDTDLTTTLPHLLLEITSTDTTNAHTIIMQESIACAKEDGTTTDDVAFNAARSFSTITLNGNANRTWQANIQLNSTDLTGCSAPGLMWVKVSRTTDTATNVGIYGLNLTQYVFPTVQAN